MALSNAVPNTFDDFALLRIPSAVLDKIKHTTQIEELTSFAAQLLESLCDMVGREWVDDSDPNNIVTTKLVCRVRQQNGTYVYYDESSDRANFAAITAGAASLTAGTSTVTVQMPAHREATEDLLQVVKPSSEFGIFYQNAADEIDDNGFAKDQFSQFNVFADLVAQFDLSTIAVDTAAPA